MKIRMDVVLDSRVDRIADKIIMRLLKTSGSNLLQKEEGDMGGVCEILITSAILSCARVCMKALVLRTLVETPEILISLNFKDVASMVHLFKHLRHKQMMEIFGEEPKTLTDYRAVVLRELSKKDYVPHPDDRKLVLKEVFSLIVLSKDQAEYVGQAVYDGLLPYASLG